MANPTGMAKTLVARALGAALPVAIIAAVAIVPVAGSVSRALAATQPAHWSQERGGPARAGFAPGSTTLLAQPPILARIGSGGPVAASPLAIDLDADGRLDVVAVSDAPNLGARVVVRAFRQVPGSFEPAWSYEVPVTSSEHAYTGAARIAAADLDGDGTIEVVVYSNYSDVGGSEGRLTILDGRNGELRATFGSAFIGKGLPIAPAVGDVTGDGKPNIVIVRATTETVPRMMLFGARFTGMALVREFDTALGTSPVTASPVLADVRPARAGLEVLVGDGADSNGFATVFLCLPNTFGANCAESATVNTGVRGIASADLDADGNLEVIVNGRTDASLFVIRGGVQPFGRPGSIAASNDGFLWNTPSVADIDGDAQPDVVNVLHSKMPTDTEQRGDVLVRAYDGSKVIKKGTLERRAATGASAQAPWGGVLADVTGDGVPEFLFPSRDGRLHAVRVANANETAPPAPLWALEVPADPSSPLAVADVTGDGRHDVIAGLADGSIIVAGVHVDPPSAPSAVHATAGDQEVMLSWTPPVEDGGADVLAYLVHRRHGGGTFTAIARVQASALGYLDTSAVNGTSYGYRVIAENAAGPGDPSETVVATPTTDGVAALSVSPDAVEFGDRRVGTASPPATFVVTSTGSARARIGAILVAGLDPGEFLVSSDSCSNARLAPGQTCSIAVRFAPTVALERSAALRIPSNASTMALELQVSGRGTEPIAELDEDAIAFDATDVGSMSDARVATVRNVGTAPLLVSSAAASGDFAVTGDGCSGTAVAPAETCTVQVRFVPSAPGERTGLLTIQTDSTGSPHTVALSGAGVGVPGITITPAAITFPSTPVGGTSAARSLAVRNDGTVAVVLGTRVMDGSHAADFAVVSDSCSGKTVAVGASCSISVSFRPAGEGTRSATLRLPFDGPNSPRAVPLSGSAFSGVSEAAVTPGSVTFAGTMVGASTGSQVITISATGTGPLAIGDISISGTAASDFIRSFDQCSRATISPGAWCSVRIAFRPTAGGDRTATLSFPTNTADGPQTVSLRGVGLIDERAPSTAFAASDPRVIVSPVTRIEGTTSDDLSGVATVYVTWRAASGETRSGTAALSCDTGRLSCGWSFPAPLLPGPLEVTVHAVDLAGNAETPHTTTYLVL